MNGENQDSESQMKTGKATMRARARIVSLIGDELISDEPVAVVELVKNAYDADANYVRVEFLHDGDKYTGLKISDDGHGMSLEDILTGWFEPGAIQKKKRLESPGGRIYQGAKGIGRFAAARLGESIFIETKRRSDEKGVTVLINWGRFDDDSYLDEVELEYEESRLGSLEHGTVLTLENVNTKKDWKESDFSELQIRLSRLISPFEDGEGDREISDFRIELIVPGYEQFTGEVRAHEITRNPTYYLTGRLDQEGRFHGEVRYQRKVYKRFDGLKLGGANEVPLCGPIEVEIRAWDRDRQGLGPFMSKYDLSLTGIRKILDDYAGVNIYRDGFRIYPYGERDIDWLSLDNRSRQNPTKHLANNQQIAAIRVSREKNPELKDRSNREGLVHNSSFDALGDWFQEILTLLEQARYALRPREQKEQTVTSLFEPFDLSGVREEAAKQLGKDHPVSGLIKKKEEELNKALEKLQQHYSRVMMAAGFGQMVDIVVHEIGAPLGRSTREALAIQRLVDDHPKNVMHDPLVKHLDNLKEYLSQIQQRREMLLPKTAGRRGRATSFAVQEEIEGNIALFESLIRRQNISVEMKLPKEPLVVHMSRSSLGQIVSNLLDNAIFWLVRHHGAGKGGKILISLKSVESGFAVEVADDGPGIDEEIEEAIFDLNFSKKPNGMGLGLYVAREVIEPYGRLTVCQNGRSGGACFSAVFERNVGL